MRATIDHVFLLDPVPDDADLTVGQMGASFWIAHSKLSNVYVSYPRYT